MFVRHPRRAAVPSRGALHALRQLTWAGSTIEAVGGVCTISYELHRRVQIAEQLVASKGELQSTCLNYNARRGMATTARMMEAAETGDFRSAESMNRDSKQHGQSAAEQTGSLGRTGSKEMGVYARVVERDTVGYRRHSVLRYVATHPSNSTKEKSNSGLEGGRNKIKIPPNKFPAPSLAKKARRKMDARSPSAHIVQVEGLLKLGEPIVAAHLFLNEFSTAPPPLSERVSKLAVSLFFANLRKNNVFLAKNLFNFLDQYNQASQMLWELLLCGLNNSGRIGSLADTFSRFAEQFELAPRLLAPVLKSLLDSYRLEEAKNFIAKYMRQRGSGLCGMYLHGLWKRTRDVALIEGQFLKLKTDLQNLDMPITYKLYNPLLKAYIEYGLDERASALAEEMERDGIKVSMRTLGLLAYGKALSCDWNGVSHYFQQLHAFHPRNNFEFVKAFDPVFLEYWLSHTGDEIRDFVFRAINDFGLVLDQVSFDHIVKAFVQKGTPEMVSDLLQVAEKKSWGVKLDKDYFEEILREHQLSSEFSPVGLRRMFRATEHKVGYAAASRRILGYDRTSFPDKESLKMPPTIEYNAWYNNAFTRGKQCEAFEQFAPLDSNMINCIHSGDLQKALSIFRNAKMSGKAVNVLHVKLAAVASVMHHGSTHKAKRLLKEENALQLGGVVPPLFFQLVLRADITSGVEAYKMGLLEFYTIVEEKWFPMKHSVIVPISARLMRNGEFGVALELYRTVNVSRYAAMKAFDAPSMKMLARGFGQTGNLEGMRWVLMTALKRKSARSHEFVVEVHRQLGSLRTFADTGQGRTKQDIDLTVKYFERLLKGVQSRLEIEMDSEQREVLRASEIGTYYKQQTTGPYYLFQGLPTAQRSSGSSDNRPNFLQTLLSEWDERAELERVFASKDDRTGDLVDWSVDSFLGEKLDDPYIDR